MRNFFTLLLAAALAGAPKVQAATTFSGQIVTPVSLADETTKVIGTVKISGAGSNAGSYTVTPGTGTFPVSGTFWQATQPVSLSAAPTTPVTGTFFQATQPVSGANAGSYTVTPGTGTFPVSGPATDAQMRATPIPVSFTPAAGQGAAHTTSTSVYITGQSGALSVFISSPISTTADGSTFTLTNPGNVRLAQINGALSVVSTSTLLSAGTAEIGNVKNTGTFAVQSAATLAAETTKVIGTVNVSAGQSIGTTGTYFQALQPVSVHGTTFTAVNPGMVYLSGVSGALPVTSTATTISSQNGALSIVSTSVWITFPTLPLNGVRPSTGVSVQALKDVGRTIFIATGSVNGIVVNTLVSMSPSLNLSGGVAVTSMGVTAGKRLRLQSWCVTWRNGTAAAGGVTMHLRGMPSGATTAASPLISVLNASTALATVGSGATECQVFPDGIDLSGNMTFGVSQMAVTAVAGSCVTVNGFEY